MSLTGEFESIDVLIMGAGITGVALAIGLHKRGYKVLLVERTPRPTPTFKGEFLQPLAVHIARSVGLHSILEGEGVHDIRTLRFRDLADDQDHVMSECSLSYPNGVPAKSISHHRLSSRLRAYAQLALRDQFWPGTTARLVNHDQVGYLHQPVIELKHPDRGSLCIRPKWVIGADGRTSMVRTWMKGGLLKKDAPAVTGARPEFIVGAEIPTPSLQPTQYEVLRTFRGGTLSFFALENGQRVYWNQRAQTEQKNMKRQWMQELQHLTEHSPAVRSFGAIDSQLMNGAPAGTQWLGPASRGRFLLAGDAVAITTPFGGQGMTCAMTHVRELLENFNFDTHQSTEIQSSCERYTRAVSHSFQRVNTINAALYYLFFTRQPIFKLTTQHVFSSWEHDQSLPRRVIELFGGFSEDQLEPAEFLKLCGAHKLNLLPKTLLHVAPAPFRNPQSWLSLS